MAVYEFNDAKNTKLAVGRWAYRKEPKILMGHESEIFPQMKRTTTTKKQNNNIVIYKYIACKSRWNFVEKPDW